ncbi:LysR family transcriptional regulator [Sorangium sp. So ce291]|uniref:LysR family transcriptional regulator n=1 Tax=Sorangium sp. So ce291 TaxID=3133294 RepID=UPI003F5F1EEB
MESLSALGVVIEVVDRGSFAAAGRALGVSASAVGKSITRLEERVGARLFQRTSRSLRLTPEGERFVERCRRILAEVGAAEAELAEANGEPRGTLRISVPVAGGPFRSVLADFQEAYPSVVLEIESTNRYVDLVREGFDAAIRSGALEDSTLTARYLGAFRALLVGSPEYLARRGTPRRPRDLARHDLLQLRLSTSGRLHALTVREPADSAPRFARTSVVANNLDLLIHFAVRGRGLAYVADMLIRDELEAGTLVPVLADQVGAPVACHVVWPEAKHVPPKLRVFIDHLAEHLLPER